MNTIVIRTEQENETEWGLSFSNHNPEPKDYFKMLDETTAFRLRDYLAVNPPISRNSPVSLPVNEVCLLESSTINETSSTGTTGERIIYALYNEIVDDIIKMVSDGINSKEEHDEYLKAIGYEKYVKDLEHFKENHFGLNATDKPIGDLLQMFWQRSSDACPLECGEAEKQEIEFAEWVKTISWVII